MSPNEMPLGADEFGRMNMSCLNWIGRVGTAEKKVHDCIKENQPSVLLRNEENYKIVSLRMAVADSFSKAWQKDGDGNAPKINTTTASQVW